MNEMKKDVKIAKKRYATKRRNKCFQTTVYFDYVIQWQPSVGTNSVFFIMISQKIGSITAEFFQFYETFRDESSTS